MISYLPLTELQVLLASQSPRRKKLLKSLDVNVKVVKVNVKETYPKALKAKDVAEFLAVKKAKGFKDELKKTQVLITADTVVIYKNKIFGKPKNSIDAQKMLEELSGKTHEVITGVCIRSATKELSFSETTKVSLERLSSNEISHYVYNYEVLDKAGAYGIQDWFGLATIKKIDGCYYNVMGLPTQKVFKALKNL